MNQPSTRDAFRTQIQAVISFIGRQPLDQNLQARLNEEFSADNPAFAELVATCQKAISEGWMCEREAGGIRYGRVFKPAEELGGFSVDVVDMNDIKGPHHRHPNGEIDLVMPLSPSARFDGHAAGWVVYGPDSAHHPTVSGGQALVLYLLPQGAIEFTR